MESINQTPFIDKIIIYPIKSLDGLSISKATLLKSGALEYDRQWAIFTKNNKLIHAKTNNKIYKLRATYNDSVSQVNLEHKDNNLKQTFDLEEERKEIAKFLSEYLKYLDFQD